MSRDAVTTTPDGSHGRRVRSLVVATSCNSAAVLPAGLTVILAVQIRRDLDITAFQFGLAFTVYSAGIALFSATLGRRADRLGSRRSTFVSLSVSAVVLSAVAAFADSLVSLLPLLFLAGVNVAFAIPTTALSPAESFPADRRGATFGIKEASISLTFLLAGLAVPTVALTIGWRWAFVVGLAIPVAAIAVLSAPSASSIDAARSSRRQPGAGAPVATVTAGNTARVHVPNGLRLVAVGAAFAAASVSGVVGFAVLSAVDVGMSESGAGLLIAAASVAGIIADIGVGVIADRRRSGGFPEAAAVLALGALGYGIFAMQSPVAAVVGTMFGYMFGWAFSGLLHLGAVTALPEAPAAATGAVQVGAGIGLCLGPITFGSLVEVSGYPLAWSAMAVLATAAAITVRLAAVRLPAHQVAHAGGATR